MRRPWKKLPGQRPNRNEDYMNEQTLRLEVTIYYLPEYNSQGFKRGKN